jgi:hypothetical protein
MEAGAQAWPEAWPLRLGVGIVVQVGAAVVPPVGAAVAVSIAVRGGVAVRMPVGVGVVATCSFGRRGAGGADASLTERFAAAPNPPRGEQPPSNLALSALLLRELSRVRFGV